MEERGPEIEVEEAGQVFLLMKKDYRISRNVRLAWFLSNLHQVVSQIPESELVRSDNELDVISILPNGWQPGEIVRPRAYLLVPSTRVTFLARQYRFVIELDLSPSTGIVDDSTGEIIFDEVFHALSHCLVGLLRPFRIPGSDILYRPEIFVTIQAYSSIIGLQSHQVLVQGCQLDEAKLESFLQQVYTQLGTFESKVAEMLQQQYEPQTLMQEAFLDPESSLEDHPEDRKQGISMVTADIGLVSMIRQGILALQLLPANSSAGIIIITDGVTSVPDVAVCETLLSQLRSGTVACSFVQVGAVFSYDCSFGHVPNVELMKFIAMATFGSYLSSCPEVEPSNLYMNIYHKTFLLYSFLRTGESMNPEYYCVSQHKLFNEHLVSASSNPALAMRRKKHTEKEVHADLVSVVSVRLREGYCVRDISISKGSAFLDVKLVLLWKHNMRIEYLAAAPWPLDSSKRTTLVEVTMEGSYDILHDISCTMRKPITSLYRTSVIRRFWNTLQSINQTDQMLVHLQSFDSVPEHYTIPESTKNGVPLFYLPPGSTTPVLSLQHSSSDSSHSQFASYWKPILSMDANFWQRWLHTHRIGLLLEHDMPVPKHLHTPGNNGRCSAIQCRISHSALTSLLRDWSSFVLVEGYSYVKLIFSSLDQSPSSFYIVRLISKAPCMVLRLGFPIGTPAQTRNKIVEALRIQILKLRFPHRVQSKEVTPKVKRKVFGSSSPSKSPPLPSTPPAFSDRPCLVVLQKPLEKLLIRYEKLPLDYRTPFILNMESFGQHPTLSGPLTMAANRTASSTLASLSRYFYHQRWIWSVQSGMAPAVPLAAVGQILATLTEIRLSEGFHFASSGEGVVSMVLELPIQSDCLNETEKHSCIVQYILFPPHATSTKDSFSTDDDNDTEVEAIEVDTELNLVTECWVEPQSGHVVSTSGVRMHLQGLSYTEIPKVLYPRDLSCISTMLTFEYVSQLCQNKDRESPTLATVGDEGPSMGSGQCIYEIPFRFDLMKLLPKCQQIEMFFLTLIKENEEEVVKDSANVPNDLLLSLFHGCLQQDLSDQEIPLSDMDYVGFMEQVLQRDREGHVLPFPLPAIPEEAVKTPAPPERQDTAMSFHTVLSNREVTGSTSTLQSLCITDLTEDDATPVSSETRLPHWRCYAKLVNLQHILLTFLPATFADVQNLMPSLANNPPTDEGRFEDSPSGVVHMSMGVPGNASEKKVEWKIGTVPTLSITPATNGKFDRMEHGGMQKRESHISFSQQTSQVDLSDPRRLRCPVYVYNCALEALREQLVNPRPEKTARDIFFSEYRQQDCGTWEVFSDVKTRSHSMERPPAASWIDIKQKELVNYCTLLQEHYHQCYVKGLYKSLQQCYSISHQDLLTAMDYCEEHLEEIDITSFLQTLCGHVRSFRENNNLLGPAPSDSFQNGIMEPKEESTPRPRGVLLSESSVELDDFSEQEFPFSSHAAAPPGATEEQQLKILRNAEFSLSLLDSDQPCEVCPDLHRIIQDKFLEIGRLYFKTVPSNPHYFFYCPPSSKKEESHQDVQERTRSDDLETSETEMAAEDGNASGCAIVTESDPDLEVEYRDKSDLEFQDIDSPSDSNTVNQDDDSFSVLGGDSLNEQDFLEQEMPPLFVQLICSVTVKNQHGSMPVQTLPTCLGEVLACLENRSTIQSIDLNDLNVALDIYILTLPLEIDVLHSDIQHNRYTSESSTSFTRSPGQSSSFRSDEEMVPAFDRFPSTVDERVSALSKLPVVHKEAIEATMNEIRWLLEDEIVSALRHSKTINSSVLRKVADHVFNSQGRPSCHSEVVRLQFVFGPEQSLEKFKEEFRRVSLPGYVLNEEDSDYHYVSVSRLHSQRLDAGQSPGSTLVMIHDPPAEAEVFPLIDGERNAGIPGRANGEEETEGFWHQHHRDRSMGRESETVPLSSHVKLVEDARESPVPAEAGVPVLPGRIQSQEKVTPGESRMVEKLTAEDSSSNETTRATCPGATASVSEKAPAEQSPYKIPGAVSLPDSGQSGTQSSRGLVKQRPSRVQSLVSSQGSMDSDQQGYDGGSSDSEVEDAAIGDQDSKCPLMPDFWLIIKIRHDRVEVYSHTRSASYTKTKDEDEIEESLRLHQVVVRNIGEICRVVNQRLLLQDLHDSHVCNTLLVAESEDDIWKPETLYNYRQRTLQNDEYSAEESYQPRDYLAATMQFIPGHFACDLVWSTIIHIHPRLKMGPNMGVSRAIQALRSVLNAFSVVNRKNMFVYQERSTKAVFYLRLSETTCTGKPWDGDYTPALLSRSLALARSQEPIGSEDAMGSRSSLDAISSRSSELSRPVGQVDKHILLMVHGVGEAGPEITDELVKVLRRRLDEATLDIITVMLVRNCKLTPADVEFIQPLGVPPTEFFQFAIPQSSLPWLYAVAYYLRQNLLIFLHTPKYTDSNVEHHFRHYLHQNSCTPEMDLFLYNKPGGQGTGGKGIACISLSFVDENLSPISLASGDQLDAGLLGGPSAVPLCNLDFESLTAVRKLEVGSEQSASGPLVRFNIWEKGNVSPQQLSEKLSSALRHALCDTIMEYRLLPAPLCLESSCPVQVAELEDVINGRLRRTMSDTKGLSLTVSAAGKVCPRPLHFSSAAIAGTMGTDVITPPSRMGRRSFWDMLSKPESAEFSTPKTTDDIILERSEESRTRRRHKTESVKQVSSQERAAAAALEQAQRKRLSQIEEGELGSLHSIFSRTCREWMAFMGQLGCPSIQQCSVEIVSRFLLAPILMEMDGLVTSLACDTTVKAFERVGCRQGSTFVPYSVKHHTSSRPAVVREFILLGRSFHQWRYSTEQAWSGDEEDRANVVNFFKPHKGFQRFEAMEQNFADRVPDAVTSTKDMVPRQRFLVIHIIDKKLTLYTYNWSPDLGASLSRSLQRLIQWQNARSHVVHCLLSQKLGLFHHCCFADPPWHEDTKQEANPFLNSTVEADTLLRYATPPASKDQVRLGTPGRSQPALHFPPDIVMFDEALRDIVAVRPAHYASEVGLQDTVSIYGAHFLEIKSMERRELEKQLKIENLFVTWQQRSAQSNMPITPADLDTLKQSSRLVHYCATPLLFDAAIRQQLQADQQVKCEGKKRHRSNDSNASGRDRSHSCDSVEMLPSKLREEPWLLEICSTFMQQYIQYLQSMGFILVQVRPHSPARSTNRIRALASLISEGRSSFSFSKQKSEGSPKNTGPSIPTYHLQRALPGGIVLMELAFQGCYFCVKQYALECSRIPMGQSVNSQLSMLFTEECDKVRDLMHVHSFSYDFHLRIVHQYLLGSHMTLRQGYHLISFLEDFITQHPDIPKFGRNHVFQGMLVLATNMIAAHQLYNYIVDHANTYHMKPLRMSRPALPNNDGKKAQNSEQNEYALVSVWNSSGSYKDSEGLRHHDDFDVSLLVCHNAAPFEEQAETEKNILRLRFYVIMTSQRELFPRLTADMRRFKKLPRMHKDPQEPLMGKGSWEPDDSEPEKKLDPDLWDEVDDGSEFYAGGSQVKMAPGLFYTSPLFPLLASKVTSAQKQLTGLVQLAKRHCRRDNLWKRLFLLEPHASDKLKLGKLSMQELEELLEAVHCKTISDIDPQLDFLLAMSVSWYQSLIKVLLGRFQQSCRHFHSTDPGTQYLVVLNQKFTDCFVLVFLDSHSSKTSLQVVFREPFPEQPLNGESPLPQLVSTYHHLESIINAACFNLWTCLL